MSKITAPIYTLNVRVFDLRGSPKLITFFFDLDLCVWDARKGLALVNDRAFRITIARIFNLLPILELVQEPAQLDLHQVSSIAVHGH